MKRGIGLLSGVSLIISSIIGSGIFISPQNVMLYSGSVGNTLLIWLFAGVLALFGAISYAEVGTMIPKSGGEFPIIKEAFGSYPAFLFAWTSAVVLKPSSFAILSLTFAKYALAPVFGVTCVPPNLLLKLTAIVVIFLIVYVNSTSVKLSTGFLNVFTVGKICSLVIIVFGGIYMLATGHTKSFENAFAGESPSPKNIVFAFYQGLWAYDGWNQLNYIVEELKNPEKNLPKSLALAMSIIIGLYLFTNVAYLSAMSPEELMNSTAVGFTFGKEVLGPMQWIIPVFVSWSVLGACLGSCFTAGRISFVAGREGVFPQLLSMLNIEHLTPAPAVMLNGALAILMVIPNDFNTLVGYFSFCMWIFHFATCSSLLWFRYKHPDWHRPIKVPIIIPIIVCCAAICLVLLPLVSDPQIEYLFAIIFIFSGTLFYVPFVHYKVQFGFVEKLNIFAQKLMCVAPTDE